MSIFSSIAKAVTSVVKPIIGVVTGNRPTSSVVVSPVRPQPPPLASTGQNATIVREFADVLLFQRDDPSYTDKAMRCASFVKRPVVIKQVLPKRPVESSRPSRETVSSWLDIRKRKPSALKPAFVPSILDNLHPFVSQNRPQITDTIDITNASAGSRARTNVFQFMEEVSSFSTRSKNAGFSPPDNPFVEIGRLNSLRNKTDSIVPVTEAQASDIVFNIQAYVDLIEAQAQGAIDFDAGVFNAAQLEHVSLSYTGLGGSGNNAADLMRLLPNADDLKAKKAADALGILNFSRREPHMIFVAEYSPNMSEGNYGALLGWKKMPDAAGYVIKRHSVIANEDVTIEVTNDQLMKNAAYMDYVRSYVLTFYDKISPSSLCVHLDDTILSNDYYIYKVQAYQVKKDSTTAVIPSDFISLNLTGQQKIMINTRMTNLDPADIKQTGEETISPWPVFAEQLLGDASLDWVFAAANTRAAIDRKDSKADVRKYSYLNAHMKYLFEQSDAGKFVKPASLDAVRVAISDSIQTYGVMQTIESILQETGILYYFDARDARDDTTFDRAGTLDFKNSGIIGVVAAAIDPENATIDLKSLATNLAQILSDGKLEDYATNLEMVSKRTEFSKPDEIDIDPNVINDTTAESGIQFVAQLGDMTDSFVDLTTFEGISKFIRVIRVMSDFGPNRIPPKTPAPSLPSPRPPMRDLPGRTRPIELNDRYDYTETIEKAREEGKDQLASRLERLEELKSERRNNKRNVDDR